MVPEREPAGAACEDNEGCEVGLLCINLDGGNEDKKCEALPGPGQTCKGIGDLCDENAYCQQSTKTCAGLPSAGQACAPVGSNLLMRRCAPNFLCSSEDLCEAAPSAGESCDTQCQRGFACANGVCVEEAPLACTLALAGIGD